MYMSRKRRLIKRLSVGTLKICLIISFIIFIILPIIFKYSASLQRGILFLTFIAYPKNASTFNNINEFGLYGSRNFYVTHRDDDENISLVNSSDSKSDDGQIYIGVWHILPNFIVKKFAKQLNLSQDELHQFTNTIVSEADQQSLVKIENHLHDTYGEINNINQKEFFEDVLRKVTAPIVIYLHGNTGSRGQPHRVDLYKVLRNIGCHVIAIDYRGYGDSSKVQPTELGVIRDSIAVYNYVRSITKTNDIFIWGHSLGTGVSTHMLSILNQNKTIIGLNVAPKVVVLESPFNNIRDEVREHPFAKLFKNLPWFDFTIAQPMYSNCLRFESDQHIGEFRQPVLILHAEDDLVVPFRLGHMLYRSALDKRGRSWGPIEFHRFDKSHGYGHKYICRSPQLPDIIRNFFITYRNEIY